MHGKSSHISLTSEEVDDRADTASTHSLTNTLRSSTTMRMTELENQMRECRELLRSNREAARDSSDRLAANEQSLRETMETITEMTHTVAGLQTQFAGFNITMESMRLMLHTLMHQSSVNSAQVESNLPYSAFPSFPMPYHQLATISESPTHPTDLQGTGDSPSVASEDSMYRRSPEKKKTRKYDEQNISISASPQSILKMFKCASSRKEFQMKLRILFLPVLHRINIKMTLFDSHPRHKIPNIKPQEAPRTLNTQIQAIRLGVITRNESIQASVDGIRDGNRVTVKRCTVRRSWNFNSS
ncbi:hypothetical protein MHU86_5917 [Fragilaria crotonensis]|nr:hypothetical protein MHU86_5917 [Fragilaria crotonensis]